ncbi:MAG: SIMPL domain-containing protein [Dehalococcoidia bacterium]|nr:SIMPL domain-containing protein [Dehalococcoidia bacterium]
MKKYWLVAISLVLMLAIAGLSGCSAGSTTIGTVDLNSQQQGIWVSGKGEVSVTPDIATLRLGVEAQAATVAEAQTQAAEVMDRVIATLTDNGVAKKDIQTQYFSISQVTRWNRETEEEIVVGYRVTNMVIAKIREIDKAGSTIDAVAAAGGDLTRINSIGFSVDDPSAYYEEARQKAMADAKAKAEQLAKLAGVKLGKPTYISEGIQIPPIYPRGVYEEAALPAPAPTTPISPGEMELSLTVQVAYAILD